MNRTNSYNTQPCWSSWTLCLFS